MNQQDDIEDEVEMVLSNTIDRIVHLHGAEEIVAMPAQTEGDDDEHHKRRDQDEVVDDDPRRELRLELQKRRPNEFRIRKICKNGLDGKIPSAMRADVWQLLLKVDSKDRFLLDDSIRDTTQDLDNQRVIRVDAIRTRADMSIFRTTEMQELVSTLLTFYCKRKAIRYKQGLNEVLAPFIMLRRDPPLPDGTVFNMFYAFIDRFLPHMYVHEEFHALQCSFRLFRLLLLYHDPELCNHLDTHNLAPELYATPWFLTLFARNVPLEALYELWDTYLLEEDNTGAALHMYVALALTIENRKGLLETHPSDLPIYLTSVLAPCPGSADLAEGTEVHCLVNDIGKIVRNAKRFQRSTPRAFNEALTRTTLFQKCPSFKLVEQLEAQPCMFISSHQVLQFLVNKERKRDEDMFLQIVDCRPLNQYEEDHLIGSLHLDPVLLNLPEQLEAAIKALCDRCKCDPSITMHIVLIGETMDISPGSSSDQHQTTGQVHQDCLMFIYHVIQKGFARVCCVPGGWNDIKALQTPEPVFENGPTFHKLVEIPVAKPRTITLESLKDVFMGSEVPPAAPVDGAKSPPSAGKSWVQRIGRSLGDAPSSIGGFFSVDGRRSRSGSSISENGNNSSGENLAKEKESPSPATGTTTSTVQGGIMSRVMTKMKNLAEDLSPNSAKKEDEDEGKTSFEKTLEEKGPSVDDGKWVDTSMLTQDNNTKVFTGMIFLDKSAQQPCIVSVTPNYVLHLKPHPDRKQFAKVMDKYLIRDLVKITSKKSIPNLVVFHFKQPSPAQPLKISFLLNQSRDCISVVKSNYNTMNS